MRCVGCGLGIPGIEAWWLLALARSWFSLMFIWDMMTENGKPTGQGEKNLNFQITKSSNKR